jgi:hypothetical protein
LSLIRRHQAKYDDRIGGWLFNTVPFTS